MARLAVLELALLCTCSEWQRLTSQSPERGWSVEHQVSESRLQAIRMPSACILLPSDCVGTSPLGASLPPSSSSIIVR